ncbi:MAG TPA: hypothetical protein VLD59_07735 [Steroidobacteraceae bacterium]|nr:hypothetical protein [Steroidobacteraceae bacterium]
MNVDDDEDLASTAVHRHVKDDVDASGVRRARVAQAKAEGHSSAEAVYRTVVWLRDQLPADAQTQLAVCFEWAREGIARQSAGEITQELQALHAAYTYARDVMLTRARKGIDK